MNKTLSKAIMHWTRFRNKSLRTSTQKITLIENEKTMKNDDTARVLNTFFSNTVRDLKIPDYNNCDPMAENIQELVLKALVKYRNHRRILTIGEVCQVNFQFSFRYVDKDEILTEILNLDASKPCQDTDIPSRIIEENVDMFTDTLHSSLIIQFISLNFHQPLN